MKLFTAIRKNGVALITFYAHSLREASMSAVSAFCSYQRTDLYCIWRSEGCLITSGRHGPTEAQPTRK